jgi:hypothetical protein
MIHFGFAGGGNSGRSILLASPAALNNESALYLAVPNPLVLMSQLRNCITFCIVLVMTVMAYCSILSSMTKQLPTFLTQQQEHSVSRHASTFNTN